MGSGPTVGVRGEAAEGSGRSGPKIRKRFGGHQQGDERGRGMYMYCTCISFNTTKIHENQAISAAFVHYTDFMYNASLARFW